MSDLTVEAEKSRAAKIALRSRLLTARRSMPPAERLASAAHLQDQVLAFVRREHPPTIAAYVPVGAEPGGADLPHVLAAAGVRVLLPVLLPDHDLDWAVFTGSLVPGPRGLSEPDGERLGVDGIRSASLILVPALAVDRAGRRMGRGGGSYDRALARAYAPRPTDAPSRTDMPDWVDVPRPTDAPSRIDMPGQADVPGAFDASGRMPGAVGALVVALLHDGELVDSVPAEPHDQPVHGVITPTNGFVRF